MRKISLRYFLPLLWYMQNGEQHQLKPLRRERSFEIEALTCVYKKNIIKTILCVFGPGQWNVNPQGSHALCSRLRRKNHTLLSLPTQAKPCGRPPRHSHQPRSRPATLQAAQVRAIKHQQHHSGQNLIQAFAFIRNRKFFFTSNCPYLYHWASHPEKCWNAIKKDRLSILNPPPKIIPSRSDFQQGVNTPLLPKNFAPVAAKRHKSPRSSSPPAHSHFFERQFLLDRCARSVHAFFLSSGLWNSSLERELVWR